jgi:alkanesulfonate monooxygenase SsuD/methylene tetrahydromethanopterin reductase-like flavin-dependent oxidoreductase (luciferase family)
MRVGVGLPAAVPGTDMRLIGRWAAAAEDAGFASVGVIDRLVYDNLDPLTALAAAAAPTSRIGLVSSVINVCWRNNAVLLAKQLSSVQRLAGGRLTAGLGMGGWPADYEASGVPLTRRGALFDASLATMQRTWQQTGDPPKIVLAATAPAAFPRAARAISEGWVAPLFGMALLKDGVAAVRQAWTTAGRAGRPRIVTGRYFSLGRGAGQTADAYLTHYYGADALEAARADTLTTDERIHDELRQLARAGVDDVVLFPCACDLEQLPLLARIVNDATHTPEDPDTSTHEERHR